MAPLIGAPIAQPTSAHNSLGSAMANYHSIVWIDHHKAVVWNFTDDAGTKSVVKTPDQHEHTHIRKSPHGGHKIPDAIEFFEDVAKVLAGVREILVIGPAQTKDEFLAFVRKKHPQIRSEIVAVERSDHPTDPELLVYARKYFTILDRKL
jgi:stalled ribosome rescue protein Dom34